MKGNVTVEISTIRTALSYIIANKPLNYSINIKDAPKECYQPKEVKNGVL